MVNRPRRIYFRIYSTRNLRQFPAIETTWITFRLLDLVFHLLSARFFEKEGRVDLREKKGRKKKMKRVEYRMHAAGWGDVSREEKRNDRETDGGERRRGERRFRRVIGSAGVDAILSSIPHQPPPGNLYLLSLNLSHSTPVLTFRYLPPWQLASRVQRIPSGLLEK